MIVACRKCGTKNRVDDRAQTRQPVCGKCGAALPATLGKPLEVTDASFASKVLGNKGTVLVDCWAPWCGPCRMIAPTIDQLAAEAAGKYVVAKLNTDENPQIASRYRIDSIPTLLVFKGGQLADRIVGLQSKQAIAARLARAGESMESSFR